jgi:hypothetical protein
MLDGLRSGGHSAEDEHELQLLRADVAAFERLTARRKRLAAQWHEVRDEIERSAPSCASQTQMTHLLNLQRALGVVADVERTVAEAAAACRAAGKKREAAVLLALIGGPAPAPDIAAAPPSAAPPPVESNGPERRAHRLLAEAQRRYAQGDALLAIELLDDAIRDLGGGPAEPLRTQLTLWSGARQRLVEQYLACGEASLTEEHPEVAYACYRTVLTLDPRHGVARDRLRKLEALKKLRDGG